MPSSPPSPASFSFVSGGPARILTVDDDPIMREFAAVYLATPSNSVDSAEDAQAGLSMLEQNDYDILVLDIEMPGMDGIALVSEIRSRPRFADLPIVMVTGCEDIVSIDRAFAAGATSFVTKPVNWRLLSYHLRYVLRASGQARTKYPVAPNALAAQSLVRPLVASGVSASRPCKRRQGHPAFSTTSTATLQ